jgi:hypothetical protein
MERQTEKERGIRKKYIKMSNKNLSFHTLLIFSKLANFEKYCSSNYQFERGHCLLFAYLLKRNKIVYVVKKNINCE